MVDGSDATGPVFATVFCTWMLCPCPADAGGLVMEVTTRSGTAWIVIVPAAIVQLLPSTDSATNSLPSAQAWTW